MGFSRMGEAIVTREMGIGSNTDERFFMFVDKPYSGEYSPKHERRDLLSCHEVLSGMCNVLYIRLPHTCISEGTHALGRPASYPMSDQCHLLKGWLFCFKEERRRRYGTSGQ